MITNTKHSSILKETSTRTSCLLRDSKTISIILTIALTLLLCRLIKKIKSKNTTQEKSKNTLENKKDKEIEKTNTNAPQIQDPLSEEDQSTKAIIENTEDSPKTQKQCDNSVKDTKEDAKMFNGDKPTIELENAENLTPDNNSDTKNTEQFPNASQHQEDIIEPSFEYKTLQQKENNCNSENQYESLLFLLSNDQFFLNDPDVAFQINKLQSIESSLMQNRAELKETEEQLNIAYKEKELSEQQLKEEQNKCDEIKNTTQELEDKILVNDLTLTS